jgi:hypothetical protein
VDASLITSILALGASAWAGWTGTVQARLARRAAEAAEQDARIAREALRLAAPPEFQAAVVDHAPSSWYSLELRLRASPLGDVDLGDLTVEIPRFSRMLFAGSQFGLEGPSPSRAVRTYEPLRVGGDPASWKVQLGEGDAGPTVLRITCRLQGMTWTVAVSVDVPVDILETIW